MILSRRVGGIKNKGGGIKEKTKNCSLRKGLYQLSLLKRRTMLL
jgi:hypothetical protein